MEIIYIIVAVTLLYILLYIKDDINKVKYIDENLKLKGSIFNLILKSINICNILYKTNRHIDANNFLFDIKHNITFLSKTDYLDFNKKKIISKSILELKNNMLTLGALNSYGDKFFKEINEILNQ